MSLLKYLLLLLTMPLLFACSDGNDNNNSRSSDDPDPAELRLTHASADAPAVNVYVDGAPALENVDFAQSSGLIEFAPGTYEVEVRGILPDGSETSVIGPVELTLDEGVRTDVIALDNLFDDTGNVTITAKILDPIAIEDDVSDVRVTVLHAAPGVPTVDIYVTGPGDALADTAPITAAFGDAAGPVSLSADTAYQIRIAPTGTQDVVYDSGPLSFPAGTELVVAAVPNTYKLQPSPVTLLAIGAAGASEVVDVNTGAAVRVVHNSADTPAVDVLVDGAEALDALVFPDATAYDQLEAPAGDYNVVVAADADNSIAPIDVDLTLEQTKSYTVLAVGSLADGSLAPVLTEDARRNIATAAIVEVIHGSYLVAKDIPVDVYLTSDGVIADAAPAIAALAYPESTGQLPLTPGDYWITVTAAGDKAVVAYDSGGTLALEGNVNYTVIARDPADGEDIGGNLVTVTLLTD